MMRGPTHVGAAVRHADGSIETRVEPFASVLKQHPYLNVPFFRGVIALFEMLNLGMSYLNWSSNLVLEDQRSKVATGDVLTVPVVDPLVSVPVPVPVPTAVTAPAGKSTAVASAPLTAAAPPAGSKPLPIWAFSLTVAVSLGLGMLLFVALPNEIAELMRPLLGIKGKPVDVPHQILLNLLEGCVKLAIFIAYVWVIGRRKDIRRVFQYHGAEHKVVYAAENNRPLTPEGARPFDTPHPRCGTGFALLTVFVSILCFSLLPWNVGAVMRVVMRLALLPVVAGVSYEIIKATVNPHLRVLATIVVTPGMWLQRLTTLQPDDSQLEVACAAMLAVLEEEKKTLAAAEG